MYLLIGLKCLNMDATPKLVSVIGLGWQVWLRLSWQVGSALHKTNDYVLRVNPDSPVVGPHLVF